MTERARELGGTKWSASKITRLERDEWVRPKLEDVELLLDIYDIRGLVERDEYIRLAKEARQKSWWRSYEDVIEGKLTGLEPGAARSRDVALTVIPGLLRTQADARAVIIGGGIIDPQEIDRRVEARMLRQRIPRVSVCECIRSGHPGVRPALGRPHQLRGQPWHPSNPDP